jgi:hypothetical protein
MVDEQKVKQILARHKDEMDLEFFEKHLQDINRMFGTNFKAEDFTSP